MRPAALGRLVLLAALAAAMVAGRSGLALSQPAPAQPAPAAPQESVTIEAPGGRFAIRVDALTTHAELLGVRAPAGRAFAVVSATLINPAPDRAVAMPDLGPAFLLQLGTEYAAPDPLAADMPDAVADTVLVPGETRPASFVFEVPAGEIGAARLVSVGTALGTVLVPVRAAEAFDPPPAIRRPVEAGDIGLAVTGVETGATLFGLQAAAGRRLVAVDLWAAAAPDVAAADMVLTDALHLEDAGGTHAPIRATATFSAATRYWPGLPYSGTILFEVDADGDPLALVLARPGGSARVPLTGARVPPETPAGGAALVRLEPAPPQGLTNVGHVRHGTIATGSGAYALNDGTHSGVDAFARFGEALTMTLPRAYAIRRLDLVFAGEGVHFRVEGSLDGETWSTLAQETDRIPSGLVQVPLGDVRARYLRVSGLPTPGVDRQSIRLLELEAYTGERVFTEGTNLARWWYLPELIAASDAADTAAAVFDEDTRYSHRKLWRPAVGAEADPPSLTIAFHERRLAAIDGVMIQFDTGGRAADWVEVWASTTGTAAADFARVGRFPIERDRQADPIEFPAIEARYLTFRFFVDAPDQAAVSVVSIKVHEADVVGRPKFLAGRLAPIVPRRSAAGGANLADRYSGAALEEADRGELVGLSARPPDALHDRVLDFASEFRLPSKAPDGGPSRLTFAMPGHQLAKVKAVRIDAANLYGDGNLPWQIRLSASTGTGTAAGAGAGDAPFEEIGTYLLEPRNGMREISFEPVDLRRLRVEVLKHYGTYSAIAEIEIIEAQAPDYVSLFDRPATPRPVSGPNLAHVDLGGRVHTPPPLSHPRAVREGWSPVALQDGLTTDPSGFLNVSPGYSTEPGIAFPVDFDVTFHQGRTARVVGVVVDSATKIRERGPLDGSYKGALEDRPRQVEVWGRAVGPASGWTLIREAATLVSHPGPQVLAFDRPHEVAAVRLRVVSNFGGDRVQLGELEVLEAPQSESYESILAELQPNIATVGLGAGLIRFTSQRYLSPLTTPDRATSHSVSALLNPRSGEPYWQAETADLPQRFLYHFHRADVARIALVEVTLPPGIDPEHRPRTATLAATTSTDPTRGWREVGAITFPEGTDGAMLWPDEPIEARYLRLSVIEGGGGPVALASIQVVEEVAPGHPSVLAHPAPVPDRAAARIEPGDADREPNDTAATALPLALGAPVTGTLEPASDVDHYRLDLTGTAAPLAEIDLSGDPLIKTALTVRDGAGRVVAAHDPAVSARETTLGFAASPQPYTLSLEQAPTSVVLLIDDSGSMRSALSSVKLAASAFARGIRPDEQMAIVRFGRGITLLQDFTSDAARLAEAIETELNADLRGTDLYDGLAFALETLAARRGNRAVVLLSDGGDASSKLDLGEAWERLEAAGVPLYIIGLGETMPVLSERLGNTAERLLASWAASTNGAFYASPQPSRLPAVYEEVARAIRAPTRYGLRARVAEGEGLVQVVSTGERVESLAAPGRVLIIFDASGSMRAETRGGRTRIAAAREVLHRVIDTLPDRTEVALRVYGHRRPRNPKAASCTDSQLVVPFGALDRRRLRQAVDALTPQGQTPIGLSLSRLEHDFAGYEGERLVILVTDGIETCDETAAAPNWPPHVIERLQAQGVRLRVDVVGFDVEESATRDFLTAIAEAAGGRFYSAHGAAALQAALEASLRAPFAVRDRTGRVWAKGRVGDPPVALPAARFALEVAAREPIRVDPLTIRPGEVTEVSLKKEGDSIALATLYRPPDARPDRAATPQDGRAVPVAVPPGGQASPASAAPGDHATPAAVPPGDQALPASATPGDQSARQAVSPRFDVPVPRPKPRFGAAVARRPATAPAGPPATADPDLTRGIQIMLNRRGYDVGPADGLHGARTAAAIAHYERTRGWPVTGEPSRRLFEALFATVSR